MTHEPTDDEIEATIRSAPPDSVAELHAALHAVIDVHGERPETPWSEARGSGTAEDPMHMPFPLYAPEIHRLLAALDAVGAEPAFDWMSWDADERFGSAADVERARVADVARFVTTVVRGERFGDGVIAHALAQGHVVAAARRIADVAGSDGAGPSHPRATIDG